MQVFKPGNVKAGSIQAQVVIETRQVHVVVPEQLNPFRILQANETPEYIIHLYNANNVSLPYPNFMVICYNFLFQIPDFM